MKTKFTTDALPDLGLGLGLRHVHFDYILEHKPAVDWFEIISENFMRSSGRPRHVIRQIAAHYPVVMHGVSLSIGSTDPLDMNYLRLLKNLAEEIQPAWISDHLCWTGVMGLNTHDLLPVPLTPETLDHITARIHTVQEYLGRPLIIENPSTYMTYCASEIPEAEFLRELAERTGCGLLLDVNNVYVSCFNNDLDPVAYIRTLPASRVVQMHLAGHQHCGTHIIDTHDHPVVDPVWELFRMAWQHCGGASLLLEWDNHIPSFEAYHAELLKAKQFMTGTLPDTLPPTEEVQQVETVSNPISFLVPDVLEHAVLHTSNTEEP